MQPAATPPGKLSVVVPVFNERENVQPLVEEIGDTLRGWCEYEIVYVDDGSDDGTADVLDGLAGDPSRSLRIERHASRSGQSAALLSGVRAASGDWIATLDGDGQNVPGDIRKLVLKAYASHAEDRDIVCVAGMRVGRRDSLVRRLSSRIANAIRQWILADGIRDTGCGLKVFRRDAFLALPQFDHMHRFIPALFQFSGGKVLTEPVDHRPRTRGVSKYGVANRLWVGIVDLFGVFWLRRRALRQPRTSTR